MHGLTTGQNAEDLTYGQLSVRRFGKRQVRLYPIAVTAPVLLLQYVATINQIADKGIGAALCEAKVGGDITQSYFWVLGDAQEDSTVVAEERPPGHGNTLTKSL
jgi:hypothetical protein